MPTNSRAGTLCGVEEWVRQAMAATTKRLFGTDGIRGRALEPPLDESTVRCLGTALANELRASSSVPRVLLAGDTRASTELLAGWFAGSFAAAGGTVTWAEVLPTPAVSHLLRGGHLSRSIRRRVTHGQLSPLVKPRM